MRWLLLALGTLAGGALFLLGYVAGYRAGQEAEVRRWRPRLQCMHRELWRLRGGAEEYEDMQREG